MPTRAAGSIRSCEGISSWRRSGFATTTSARCQSGFDLPGSGVGQQWIPVDRAGLHVPGQAAPLVSSLLMAAVPARVAGVGETVVTTPVRSEGIAPALAAAAEVAGVDRVFGLGGAQAIAALALGTASVPRCDVIVAPGNAWVMLATRALYGVVGVDLLPGPTETLVIADAAADAAEVAADLIAQAEHGGPASPIALTSDPGYGGCEIAREVEIHSSPRCHARTWPGTASSSAAGSGSWSDLAQAVELSNGYGPEHLCLLVEDPEALLPLVRHAGGVFLGSASPEVLGDYVAGPSHIMPTGGTARFASPVGVRSFSEDGVGRASVGGPSGGPGPSGGSPGAGRGAGRPRQGRRTPGFAVTTMPRSLARRDLHD